MTEGRFPEAAAEYLRLAEEAAEPRRWELRLAAAGALIRNNDIEPARRLLDETPLPAADRGLNLRRELLRGRIALVENLPERVLDSLPREVDAAIPAPLATEIHELRSRAYAQGGNWVEAARERITLELLLTDEASIRRNRSAILEDLGNLTIRALEQVRIAPPSTLGGWIELAALVKRFGTEPGRFGQALTAWRTRFPGHPATAEILSALIETSQLESKPPRSIALLLPLQGAFAAAAEAIRDGFIAAWFMDGRGGKRPVVTIHDTVGRDIEALYREVVGNGAEFVVGPLQKEAVKALGRLGELPVRTLALNQAEPAAKGLYQFSLSPESEARQVAERAWFDGYAGAAVIAPDGEWGERVASAFTSKWESLGGIVVARQRYESTAADMSKPVQSMLKVDESYGRWRRLRRTLNADVKHEARRRQDIDLIFMAAFPRQARLLRPQFKFHRASRVPVYATSHIFTGVVDRDADRDIDGVIFADMPWVLTAPTGSPGVRERVREIWPGAKRGFTRFYAFGVDAYQILLQLRRLRAQPLAEFQGGTGRLGVDEMNRVRRRLTWAQFRDGVPGPWPRE